MGRAGGNVAIVAGAWGFRSVYIYDPKAPLTAAACASSLSVAVASCWNAGGVTLRRLVRIRCSPGARDIMMQRRPIASRSMVSQRPKAHEPPVHQTSSETLLFPVLLATTVPIK